jgi:hypothetical protein
MTIFILHGETQSQIVRLFIVEARIELGTLWP